MVKNLSCQSNEVCSALKTLGVGSRSLQVGGQEFLHKPAQMSGRGFWMLLMSARKEETAVWH